MNNSTLTQVRNRVRHLNNQTERPSFQSLPPETQNTIWDELAWTVKQEQNLAEAEERVRRIETAATGSGNPLGFLILYVLAGIAPLQKVQ